MIGIINYKMGNLQSVVNSLDYLDIPNKIISSPDKIKNCDKLILPGVGAFDLAMKRLNETGFTKGIKNFVNEGKPLLGICLGMQLLLESSEEFGYHLGLGFIKGHVYSFKDRIKKLPISHVGWNSITKKVESKLLQNIENNANFYFVHSYYCCLSNRDEVVATTDYVFDFDSILESGKIFGCQFHPEKSQQAGLSILKNFSEII